MDKERTREGRRGAEGQDQEERESRVRQGWGGRHARPNYSR